jgi:hypothetical protein
MMIWGIANESIYLYPAHALDKSISTQRAWEHNVEVDDLVGDNTGPLIELENLDKG